MHGYNTFRAGDLIFSIEEIERVYKEGVSLEEKELKWIEESLSSKESSKEE